MAPYRGVEAAAHYGDVNAESAALHSACGLLERPWISTLEMLGEDRTRFLGGYVTCDVKSLEPGAGTYGFITSVKGRVLADPVVLALEDRMWLELPPGKAEEISQHLAKYVIVDRVEIRALEGQVALSLIGPRSAEMLVSAGLPAEADWSHRTVEISDSRVLLVREPLWIARGQEIPAWTIWAPADEAQTLFEKLLDSGAGGVVPVGYRALENLRIEAGRPLYGLDFDDANFPQETGLEEQTVNYEKGCYLGQEVVARIHYRGGVNRHLRGLVFGGDETLDPAGHAVLAGGREAGTVTSAATLADGARIGLGILHKRAEPDSEVEVGDVGTARVIELPFTNL